MGCPGKGDAAFSRVTGVGGTRPEGRIPGKGHMTVAQPFEIVAPTEGYLNSYCPLDLSRHNLPHWEQSETYVFLTFRLADSLPRERLEQWSHERDAWLESHPEPLDDAMREAYARLFPARLEAWLDEGAGECLLRDERALDIVETALRHFHGLRCDMRCFTVMPNHVHVLFKPFSGHALSKLVHSWKGYSASAINRSLGRRGPVWQKEYFDTCIRDSQHFRRVVRYIWNNAPSTDRFRWADGLLVDGAGARIPGGFGDATSTCAADVGGTRPEGRIPDRCRMAEDSRFCGGRRNEGEP